MTITQNITHLIALPKSPTFCDDSGVNPDEHIGGGDDPRQPNPDHDPWYWCLPPVRDKQSAEPRGGYPMYLVTQGRKVGVWHNWTVVKAMVSGYSAGAQHGHYMLEGCIDEWQEHCALGVHPHAAAPPQRKQRGSTMAGGQRQLVEPGLQAQLQEFCIPNLDALLLGSAAETTSTSTPSNVSSVTATMWVAVPPVAQYFVLWGGRIVYTDCGDAKAAFSKAQAAGTKPHILLTTDYDEAQVFSELTQTHHPAIQTHNITPSPPLPGAVIDPPPPPPPPPPRAIITTKKVKPPQHKKGLLKGHPGKQSWVHGTKLAFFAKRKADWLREYSAADEVVHKVLDEAEKEFCAEHLKTLQNQIGALMYYDARIKQRVEARLEALNRRSDVSGEPMPRKINDIAKVTSDVWEEETPAFQHECKVDWECEYEQRLKAWEVLLTDSPTQTPEEMAVTLENTAYYLQPFVDTIQQCFGMCASVLLCRPIGMRGGKIGLQRIVFKQNAGPEQCKVQQKGPQHPDLGGGRVKAASSTPALQQASSTTATTTQRETSTPVTATQQVTSTPATATQQAMSDVRMEIDEEHGEHKVPRDGFDGERGTVVGEEYWWRCDKDPRCRGVVHAPGDRSYPVGGRRAATSAARGTRSTGSLDAEGHVVGVKNSWVVAYGSYPCDDVQERARNGGGDDADEDPSRTSELVPLLVQMEDPSCTSELIPLLVQMREDRSKWTLELGQAHTAFELGRGWGMEWSICVGKFFDFESVWGFLEKEAQVGRMYRPQQVAGWLSRGRKWMMPPTLGMDIGTRQTKDLWVGLWWKWWESLQPEERTLLDNELSYPEQASWSEMVGLHGDNGLLQVIATLVWWGKVAQKWGKAEIDDWRAAVDDVAWVRGQLLECEEVGRDDKPLPQKKRKGNTAAEKKNMMGNNEGADRADEDQPPRKKRRQANPDTGGGRHTRSKSGTEGSKSNPKGKAPLRPKPKPLYKKQA
ncbi:hypothetical protein B0H14DRAFT_3443818 [Mycena olivaceomarginata]|nr:hypothetical protein B0H14DRAFT_3443818 [Mycena olivaceomarginata]